MDALRLILLGAGLLFLALLAWLGSRRPRRVQPEGAGGNAAVRGAAAHGADGEEGGMVAQRSGASAASLDSLGPMTSSPGPAPSSALGPPMSPPLSPPIVDWSEATAGAQAAQAAAAAGAPHATLIDVPVMAPAADARRGPPRGTLAASTARATTPPPAAATDATAASTDSPDLPATHAAGGAQGAAQRAGEPELYVAWPPEAERHIVSLRVLGLRGERIPGRLLRQGLAATGFRHGPFGIYHVGHDDGRVLISAASLVRPGLLDPENMDFQHYPGVNLFAVLPAPLAPAELLDRFCATAFDLAGRIEGSVQDEGGAPLGAQESQDWRARCIAAFAQHPGAH